MKMYTEKDLVGVVRKGEDAVAITIQDKKSRLVTLYSLKKMDLEDVMDLLNGSQGDEPIKSTGTLKNGDVAITDGDDV